MNKLVLLLSIFIANCFAQSDIDWSQVKQKPLRRGSGRITNGIAAGHRFMFPYQAGILSYSETNSATWCGGSIISNQYIITAAHCLHNKVRSDIYLGVIDRVTYPLYKVDQANHIVHETYSNVTLLDDIALVKLPEPVKFITAINPILLDNDPTLTKWVNKDAVISGWGANKTGTTVQRILRYAEVTVLSNDECAQKWNRKIYDTQICQKVTDNKGICQGDSGGPLAAKENGKPVLIGLTSYTIKRDNQCEIDVPRIFTRVAAYRQWICEHTEKTVC